MAPVQANREYIRRLGINGEPFTGLLRSFLRRRSITEPGAPTPGGPSMKSRPPRVLSRRQFLIGSGSLVAGAALAPTILLPGCQRPAPVSSAGAFAGNVLRAGRFTAAPDGRSREVMGYNGQLPGPVIRAKEGD